MNIIATGIVAGELKKPYAQTVCSSDIDAVYAFLTQFPKKDKCLCEHNGDALDMLTLWYEQKRLVELMIVGAWGDSCVASTIAYALRLHIPVYCPEQYIFFKEGIVSKKESLYAAVRDSVMHLSIKEQQRIEKYQKNNRVAYTVFMYNQMHVFLPNGYIPASLSIPNVTNAGQTSALSTPKTPFQNPVAVEI